MVGRNEGHHFHIKPPYLLILIDFVKFKALARARLSLYRRIMTKFGKILGLAVLTGYLSIASWSYGAELKVALVLDKGGKDDKSFNAAAYQGAMKAKDDLKVFVKY